MKRAQSGEQKETRRLAILDAAREALDRLDYREIRLQDLAHSVGLVKGTFYRYFPTKQDLFMSLYIGELDAWLGDWSAAFGAGKPDPARLEKIILESLDARPRLIRLIGSFPGDLEPELSDDGLKEYKRFIKLYLARSAAVLETLSPSLGARAPAFLVSIFVLVQGVAPLAFPVARVAEMLRKEKEFENLCFEFRTLFAPLLSAVFAAYMA